MVSEDAVFVDFKVGFGTFSYDGCAFILTTTGNYSAEADGELLEFRENPILAREQSSSQKVMEYLTSQGVKATYFKKENNDNQKG